MQKLPESSLSKPIDERGRSLLDPLHYSEAGQSQLLGPLDYGAASNFRKAAMKSMAVTPDATPESANEAFMQGPLLLNAVMDPESPLDSIPTRYHPQIAALRNAMQRSKLARPSLPGSYMPQVEAIIRNANLALPEYAAPSYGAMGDEERARMQAAAVEASLFGNGYDVMDVMAAPLELQESNRMKKLEVDKLNRQYAIQSAEWKIAQVAREYNMSVNTFLQAVAQNDQLIDEIIASSQGLIKDEMTTDRFKAKTSAALAVKSSKAMTDMLNDMAQGKIDAASIKSSVPWLREIIDDPTAEPSIKMMASAAIANADRVSTQEAGRAAQTNLRRIMGDWYPELVRSKFAMSNAIIQSAGIGADARMYNTDAMVYINQMSREQKEKFYKSEGFKSAQAIARASIESQLKAKRDQLNYFTNQRKTQGFDQKALTDKIGQYQKDIQELETKLDKLKTNPEEVLNLLRDIDEPIQTIPFE